ncbi:SDR family oxidoreductase [Halorhabdus salina]|uniref:SDR family oxidoreductase n=1 Tax=Halorhabdus salina TaxID=2750670 RepID=UPI0015EFC97C|nr:SDR family oxidoreductase [Halorhabdus salina]
MRILVTGGSGLVGWDLVKRASEKGHKVFSTYYSSDPDTNIGERLYKLDVRDQATVRQVVSSVQPDVVVHSAAMTDVDACERNKEKAAEVNVNGTKNVVRACEDTESHLLFFSTGFVFDGDQEIYDEPDSRNSVNVYGETKITAENLVFDSDIRHTVCRIDQPFCWSKPWQSKTFVEWTLDRLRRGEPFPVFEDWHNTPVYVPDCNEMVLDLLEDAKTGTWHVVGQEFLSRHEWARIIATSFGYDPDMVQRGHSDKASLPASRPSNHLTNGKLERATGQTMRSIHDALETMVTIQP